jgi:hypothetical protein
VRARVCIVDVHVTHTFLYIFDVTICYFNVFDIIICYCLTYLTLRFAILQSGKAPIGDDGGWQPPGKHIHTHTYIHTYIHT